MVVMLIVPELVTQVEVNNIVVCVCASDQQQGSLRGK